MRNTGWPDLLGDLLRLTPPFPGKWRLHTFWLTRLSRRADYARTAKLPNGLQVSVDLRLGYERMVWLQAEEWDELQYLTKKLSPGENFVDVGANIGLWTLVAAHTVGKAGKVISLEPNPSTFEKLASNVTLNCLDSVVELHKNAASNCHKRARFVCEPNHNLSSITTSNHANSIEIQTVTLDEILDLRPIAGIKLDTEGHELEAIDGLSNTIAKFRPWLIVEFNSSHHDSATIRDWPVFKLLSSWGYRAYSYSRDARETPIEPSLVVEGYCNVLFQDQKLPPSIPPINELEQI